MLFPAYLFAGVVVLQVSSDGRFMGNGFIAGAFLIGACVLTELIKALPDFRFTDADAIADLYRDNDYLENLDRRAGFGKTSGSPGISELCRGGYLNLYMTRSETRSQQSARKPRVSVIIPVYNGAATIDRALNSVFDQSFTDYEIVICDDGSTDDTPAVLAKYGERIRIVRQANRGFPAARNAAIAAGRGELLALIDHDDEWQPRKLEVSVAALHAAPGAVLVYSDVIVVNEAGEESRASPVTPDTAHAPTMDEMLTRLWPIMPSTVVMRRDAFGRTGGFCGMGQDLDFWPLIREQGRFLYLPHRLVRFTFGQLYPKVLKRDFGPKGFVDLIRARYGSRADGLVKDFIRHRVRMIANVGVIEMSKGNMQGARQCFIRVLRYDPRHLKSYLRIARTFMPASMRRGLGGKASRGMGRP